MRKFSKRIRKGLSSPYRNKKTGEYYGRGIANKKQIKLYLRGRDVVRGIFKDRYKPAKFKKWISKYK